ncbi:hypothetical protein Pcinc_040147 [Petrolisthes cinctipes]|uniref:Uncharacterized protein n=1 Tax=Petrolisthes cinctipes TaxID=88211 RepID=A0AAE1EIU8_PETCI|nr:hypothetical protein Pcinc_040147 [Petrolisthes cinctipes]
MDTTVLKTILDSQNQAYKGALEVFMKQISEHVNSLQSTISDLRTSLEYTQKEVEELQHEIKNCKQDKKNDREVIKGLKEELQVSGKIAKELEEKVNYQDDYSRRNNLQIIGVEEQGGETWEQTANQVLKLFEEKLHLPNLQLERAHRVGRREDYRGRPNIARFSKFGDREAVMRSVTRLRGTNIFINEDLCPASQDIRRAQLPQLKKARSEGKIAYFRHTRLIIREKPNDYDESGGAEALPPSEAAVEGGLAGAGAGVNAGDSDHAFASASTPSAIGMDVPVASAGAGSGNKPKRKQFHQVGDSRTRSTSPVVIQDRENSEASQRTTRLSVRGGRKGQ